uniref:(northern house mosquito) hypothetical protein n=1 Tax=Culex pipiens TaxID=7175 RepID=A0A8D8A8X7_CULPI
MPNYAVCNNPFAHKSSYTKLMASDDTKNLCKYSKNLDKKFSGWLNTFAIFATQIPRISAESSCESVFKNATQISIDACENACVNRFYPFFKMCFPGMPSLERPIPQKCFFFLL